MGEITQVLITLLSSWIKLYLKANRPWACQLIRAGALLV